MICNTNLKYGVGAEYIKVHKDLLAKIDAGMNSEDMASLPLVSTTALSAIMSLGELESGAKVMINGASGGVGTIGNTKERVDQASEKVFSVRTLPLETLPEFSVAKTVDPPKNVKNRDFHQLQGLLKFF